MARIIVLSADAPLRERVRALAGELGLDLVELDGAPAADSTASDNGAQAVEGAALALIDLNLGEEILPWIAASGASSPSPLRIAFLDHFVGDLPIRAKIAGADRVVPRSQIEAELSKLLRQL